MFDLPHLVPFDRILNEAHYLDIQLCYDTVHAICLVQTQRKLSSRQDVCYPRYSLRYLRQ